MHEDVQALGQSQTQINEAVTRAAPCQMVCRSLGDWIVDGIQAQTLQQVMHEKTESIHERYLG